MADRKKGKVPVITTDDRRVLVHAGRFSRQTISAWENRGCNPTVRHLQTAASVLGMTVDQFLGMLENTRRQKVAMAKVSKRRKLARERREMLKRKKEEVQSATTPPVHNDRVRDMPEW